jgi:hypothetical protein
MFQFVKVAQNKGVGLLRVFLVFVAWTTFFLFRAKFILGRLGFWAQSLGFFEDFFVELRLIQVNGHKVLDILKPFRFNGRNDLFANFFLAPNKNDPIFYHFFRDLQLFQLF